ncbi:hypothetical protein [Dyella sp. EPa41]|uniref:hypothetical protein n=1 Tax=Dyella sp. EPa41 TaxID=1561194 RepID=UPI001915D362|nr:hypothetical protein [Dyella sp. EPa41]
MPVRRLVLPVMLMAAGFCAAGAAPGAHAADAGAKQTSARHFRLVNATFDSVTAFAVAPAGSDAYVEAPFASPLQGGLSSATVSVPAGECVRDVRVTFLNGRVESYPGLDICRHSGLRLTSGGGRPFRPERLVAGD